MADMVNHPPHYTKGKVEIIDVITEITRHYPAVVAYDIGCVIKYLARAPHKGTYTMDIQKAQWYMNHLVALLEARGGQEHALVEARDGRE